MQRSSHLSVFLRASLVVVVVLLGAGQLIAASQKKPNLLIITTDQQRVDALSVLGNKCVKTPHMDSIAAQGVCFTRSYCPYPLCSPSRASLHTSRMPHEIGVDHNSLAIDPTIPVSGQVFRAAGYDTGYAGKWHLPNPYPSAGIAGFEVLNKVTRRGKLAHDVDEATMTAAVEFLKRKRHKPFLLVASFINPHDICLLAGESSPLLKDVQRRYQPADGAGLPPLPANWGVEAVARRRQHEGWDLAQWRKYSYAYYRMVEDVDRQVGQILEALRQIKAEDNTLIIFTSDHGEGLGSHHWTGKMMFYEAEAAVPLIISWKGVTPAGWIDRKHLVSTLDVLPTLCAYAGVQPPAPLRGQSLRAIIEKPESPGREAVFAEMAAGGANNSQRSFMVRSNQFKYMVFPRAGRKPQEGLFDLEADPGETKNLVAEPALAGELERHRKMLAQWNEETDEGKHPLKPNPEARRKARRQK